MKKTRIYLLVSSYAILMLLILLITVLFFSFTLKELTMNYAVPSKHYIYVESSPTPSITPDSPSKEEAEGWIVKEYEGKIGIFQADGTLIYTIDTYVKTLPEADRRLLGEGLTVQTRSELNAIIEDYSH